MKKWMIENWDFILILVIIVLITMFIIFPIFNNIFTSRSNQSKENGWYEATIICDGIEIIRGQLMDLDESRNAVKVNISNEIYIVDKKNIIIHYIPYD